MGNALQFYDFFLYATAAALVFDSQFFPSSNPIVGTMGAFAGYAVGFVSRPLGGVVFGHIGDRFGRKVTLTWTLGLMGLATFAIGLLPTYSQVGMLAPALLILLRLIQGFATGGEWGGGMLMATENAPHGRRGLYGAWSQAGAGIGFILSSSAFFAARQLGGTAFLDWGWRIPFLASLIVVAAGFVIRMRVGESAEFLEAERTDPHAAPIRDVLRTQRFPLFCAAGVLLAEMSGPLLTTTFALAYGTIVGASSDLLLAGVTISMVVDTVMMLFFGHLSDRFGRTKVYGFGIVAIALAMQPFFLLLKSPSDVMVIGAFVVINGICHAAMIGTQPALLTELFPASLRSSGLALAQSIAAVLVGFVPLVATSLYYATGSVTSVTALMVVLSLISFVSLHAARRVTGE
ncbi:MFS transporter [Novosphingobium resinovorum]|uniref:MFS transporter n=1 Tax=Novosphingobium TaxID=165696 RepID=UPI001B3C6E9E|nr:MULTISPECIES: MFS transporter [Novosphingobium]MBF7013664.1 MHS family MFS transporter [Novosphingobium sp. HR1a]WJM25813.1 MFS transporter [Novosphingobium resinovorum]